MPSNGYNSNYPPSLVGFPPSMTPVLTVNTVDSVTEAIKSDRTIRQWRMDAMKVGRSRR